MPLYEYRCQKCEAELNCLFGMKKIGCVPNARVEIWKTSERNSRHHPSTPAHFRLLQARTHVVDLTYQAAWLGNIPGKGCQSDRYFRAISMVGIKTYIRAKSYVWHSVLEPWFPAAFQDLATSSYIVATSPHAYFLPFSFFLASLIHWPR